MFGQIQKHKLLLNSTIGLESKNVVVVLEALDGEKFIVLKRTKNNDPL